MWYWHLFSSLESKTLHTFNPCILYVGVRFKPHPLLPKLCHTYCSTPILRNYNFQKFKVCSWQRQRFSRLLLTASLLLKTKISVVIIAKQQTYSTHFSLIIAIHYMPLPFYGVSTKRSLQQKEKYVNYCLDNLGLCCTDTMIKDALKFKV